MAERAEFVEAVKPVVETALVEDVMASQPSNMRLILDLFQAYDADPWQSAYASTMVHGARHLPNGVLGLIFRMVRFVLGAPVFENLRLARALEVEHAFLAAFGLLVVTVFRKARQDDGGSGGCQGVERDT